MKKNLEVLAWGLKFSRRGLLLPCAGSKTMLKERFRFKGDKFVRVKITEVKP